LVLPRVRIAYCGGTLLLRLRLVCAPHLNKDFGMILKNGCYVGMALPQDLFKA
jgi:hypothetical protein